MYQHTSKAPVMSMSLPIKKLKLPWDCKAPFSSYPALVIAGWLFWKLNGNSNPEPPRLASPHVLRRPQN